MNSLKSLYRDAVRRHAAEPVGFRMAIDATHTLEGLNPQCGDRVEIHMRIRGDRIEQIAFDGEACTLCTASASLLCENLAGETVDSLKASHRTLAHGLASRDEPDASDPLAPLYGVSAFPGRIQCVLLPWKTANKAL